MNVNFIYRLLNIVPYQASPSEYLPNLNPIISVPTRRKSLKVPYLEDTISL